VVGPVGRFHATQLFRARPDQPVPDVLSEGTLRPVAVSAETATRYLFAGLRLAPGWVFLWVFIDKVFGLGYATKSANSWLNGGQPTKGFLTGAKGPFAGFYHSIAGAAWA